MNAISEPLHPDEVVFRAHLIVMPGDDGPNPTVRMLLVDTGDRRFVYEGQASWSTYKAWLSQIMEPQERGGDLWTARRSLLRERFATLRELRVPIHELGALGFHRVDEGS